MAAARSDNARVAFFLHITKKGASENIHCNRHQLGILNNYTDSGAFSFVFQSPASSPPAPPRLIGKQGVRLYTSPPPNRSDGIKTRGRGCGRGTTADILCINLQAIYVWHRRIVGKPIIYYFFFLLPIGLEKSVLLYGLRFFH